MSIALVSTDRLLSRRSVALAQLLASTPSVVSAESPQGLPLRDRLARPLTDLRLSVTDRCNFRCPYCMPRSKLGPVVAPMQRSRMLDFDELVRIASAFVELGVTKIRITGGEPLLRRDLAQLVKMLSSLSVDDLCLTTNGSLLKGQARALVDAGLRRVTVSLDALDEPTFRRMTDSQTSIAKVLEGIDMARRCGLEPVKINMVVQRGVNEHSVLPMAQWARSEGLELRYIEYMDVGRTNGWREEDVFTAAEIRDKIHQQWPVEPVETADTPATAQRFRYRDGQGEFGIIASVSRPFCRGCTRARVSSYGELYPCLFASTGLDLATPLRHGQELRPLITKLWRQRGDRYSELRSDVPSYSPRPEMSAIGG